ncbi:hypothetical protein BpHYR1_023888 [Brachionus plicatilis]|uniref:Uncharacterized protein n=1 Tax=Brachionus plicatilis TaxID=10195 RepID=A0A3M7PDF4_BRAPC|nr:hypothetical protein BpHYR1_023888 [Brachionus plicatilis]
MLEPSWKFKSIFLGNNILARIKTQYSFGSEKITFILPRIFRIELKSTKIPFQLFIQTISSLSCMTDLFLKNNFFLKHTTFLKEIKEKERVFVKFNEFLSESQGISSPQKKYTNSETRENYEQIRNKLVEKEIYFY